MLNSSSQLFVWIIISFLLNQSFENFEKLIIIVIVDRRWFLSLFLRDSILLLQFLVLGHEKHVPFIFNFDFIFELFH